jgi:hypothetical protein
MSNDSAAKGSSASQPSETITIHKRVKDVVGSGKTDKATGRYVPVGGGSRTRIPLADDKRISRYAGNLGVDASLSGKIDSMAALYAQLEAKTKQALGADFSQSIGRSELTELESEEAGDAAPLGALADAQPMEAAQEPASMDEIPARAPADDPPAPEREEPAPRREVLPKPASKWEEMII